MRLFKSIYISQHFYQASAFAAIVYVFAHFFPFMQIFAFLILLIFCFLICFDAITLFIRPTDILVAIRLTPEKLSNGDDNQVNILITSFFPYKIKIGIIDEIPFQFQNRNLYFEKVLEPNVEAQIGYKLKPVSRGEYHFGVLNIYVSSYFKFLKRRFVFEGAKMVPVYPSFIQMRKFELLAISNRLMEVGIKKIRRVSRNNEFDQIKEYVTGDDHRTINWKATARRSRLMVNQYQEEKSQQVFSLIDMGRVMKMPFNGMSLLEYAINACLVISNIAMHKHDKAGLYCFNDKIKSYLSADRGPKQLHKILEVLYNQTTDYKEPNYELLYGSIKRNIKQRSLLFLYTNFESLVNLQRQIGFLKELGKYHLLVVIFFENVELKQILNKSSENIEEVYIKTIAEKFVYEKKLIVKELNKFGVHTILTSPENLTIRAINKYLELKAIGLI